MPVEQTIGEIEFTFICHRSTEFAPILLHAILEYRIQCIIRGHWNRN